MLTREEDMEATALRKRGWTISAIARHLGRDRKTVRDYLTGKREVGKRRSPAPNVFGRLEPYLRQRLTDDPHVWATVLYDEVVALGYERSYVTFARQLRLRGLRPHCEPCSGVKGRATIEIEHPAGEEIQWDWLELPETPWGEEAHVLVGTLPHSGRIRAVFAEAEDQAHLIEAMDAVCRRLGGTARRWRVDRMATIVNPDTGKVQASFAPVAKHYGVIVDACPPRRANRKGSVEKSNDYLAQRWWRTARVRTKAEAQVSLDRFCSTTADARKRPLSRLALHDFDAKVRPTVGELAEREQLLALPAAPYPAAIERGRTVGPSSLVAFRGNRYSVAPGLEGTEVTARHRLGSGTVEIVSTAGTVLASHRLVPEGAGQICRSPEHKAALEATVLGAFTTARPCKRKVNRPPSDAAMEEAAKLLLAAFPGSEVVVDLSRYAEAVGTR